MDNFQRAIYIFVLVVGTVSMVPFLMATLYKILKTGVIERRPPKPSFTRTGNPKAFWATIGFMAVGPAIMVWGMGVMLYRLWHS